VCILSLCRLHFYINHTGLRMVLNESQHLVESRNELPGVFGARELMMSAIEPTAHLSHAKFAREHLGNQPFTKCRSAQVRVVNYYRNTVARQTNVQFNSHGPVNESPRERNESIFRGYCCRAAVADYE